MKKILFQALAIASALFVFTSKTQALDFTDNFTVNPLTNGWQIFGDTNLFQWDATNHDIAVTWDSSQSNSYFYYPLGITLTTNSSFRFSFDMNISDATIIGGTFQLSAGLFNFDEAISTNYLRGTGDNTTNEVEFDYFMDPMFGNSVAATEIDTNGYLADVYDDVAFDTNTTYHITVTYYAGDPLISSQVTVSNQPLSFLPGAYIEYGFGNFYLDTLAIMSYSALEAYNDDGGQGGVSLLAHGTIANFSFTTCPNPVVNFSGTLTNQVWQGQFQSFSNWVYTLQRSTDLKSWAPIPPSTNGTDQIIVLQDTNAPPTQAFYRIQAQR